jgi:hypothetical protein
MICWFRERQTRRRTPAAIDDVKGTTQSGRNVIATVRQLR